MSPQDEFASFESFDEPKPESAQPESAASEFEDEFASFGTSEGQGAAAPSAGNAWEGEPSFTAEPSSSAEGDVTKDNLAIASTVVGVLSLCFGIVPICGFPLSLAALGLGAFSLKAPNRRTLAIAGMVLGGLAILLSICSGIFGFVSYLQGQGG